MGRGETEVERGVEEEGEDRETSVNDYETMKQLAWRLSHAKTAAQDLWLELSQLTTALGDIAAQMRHAEKENKP